MNNIFSGQINVESFWIETADGGISVKMQCEDENGKAYFIIFGNVSKINMSDVSYPFQICGFEIADNSSRGYQSDCRFFVNDYEDGILSFYCESFDIISQ